MGRFCLAAIVALVLGPPPAPGQADEAVQAVKIPGEDRTLASRLAAADKKAQAGLWAEAVNDYLQLDAEAGDELLPLSPRQSVRARLACQVRLAALPPEGLKLYRDRVGPQARRLLEQGVARRDPALLRRLVETAFASPVTEQALDWLGDLAFERGAFEEAERWWSKLLPSPGGGRWELVFPQPRTEEARFQAKLLLARIFRGERLLVGEDLRHYRQQYPQAAGLLAGKQALYADTLEQLASRPEDLTAPAADDPWLTFAVAASRAGRLARAPGRLSQLRPPEGPPRRIRLTATDRLADEPDKVLSLTRPLPYYPIVVGDQVLVADARSVTAIGLRDGRRLRFDFGAEQPLAQFSGSLSGLGSGFTLTAFGDRVFARFGPFGSGMGLLRRFDPGAPASTWLACLQLRRDDQGKPQAWDVQWQVKMTFPRVFEGTALVEHGRAYVAVSRFEDGLTHSAIHCYDADTGHLLWQRDLCKAPERGPRTRSHLVALAGPYLVYCNHAGAIVAVEARNGRPVWAVRYPSRGSSTAGGDPSPRDLAPCLCVGGRVYVAPVDYDRILCLDQDTGSLLWESGPVEVVHLLGVGCGKLIFTYRVPRTFPAGIPSGGIRALDAATGEPLRSWMQPADGSDLPSFGRGFLAGDLVIWPTRDGLRVLRQEDGEAELVERDFFSGNLAAGGECLVSAGADELAIYGPARWLLESGEAEGAIQATEPDSLARREAQYYLGLAQADAGLDQAISNLRDAADGAPSAKLRRQARQRLHELLLDRAARQASRRQWQQAVADLELAASPLFDVADRLRAGQRLAALWNEQGKHGEAAQTWRRILTSPELARGILLENGLPQNAAIVARARLGEPASPSTSPAPPAKLPTALPRPATAWDLPLTQAWQIDLADESVVPAAAGSQAVYTARGLQLNCRDPATGRVLWSSVLPAAPTWVGDSADLLLVGTQQAVLGLRRETGQVAWSWTADLAAETGPAAAALARSPGLSDFRLAANRLYCLQGRCRLLAFEVASGRVLLARWAPGATVVPPLPAGCFFSRYYGGTDVVVLQTSSGVGLVLEAHTGRTLAEIRGERLPWPEEPVRLDEGQFAWTPDGRQVVRLSVTGRPPELLWTADDARGSSFSGEPLQLLGDRQRLFLLVPRNHVVELECLNLVGGQGWRWPLAPGSAADNTQLLAWDASAVYLVSRGVLMARSASDGRPVWQTPLPGGATRWRALRVGAHLLVHPHHPHGPLLEETAAVGVLAASHSVGTALLLRRAAQLARGGGMPVSLSLLGVEATTGRVVQQLSMAAAGRRSGVWMHRDGVIVALGNRVWGLRPSEGP